MEHLLNAKLRNQAFGKFIVFFVLTIGIIVTAVYFDFSIRSKETNLLREKIRNFENQMYHQEQFIVLMDTAKNLIDSMGKSAQFNPLLDREIADKLKTIRNSGDQGKGIYGTMNKEIFNLFYDYSELNKKLLQSKNAIQQVEKLKNELGQSETRRIEAERSLDIFRRSNNLGL